MPRISESTKMLLLRTNPLLWDYYVYPNAIFKIVLDKFFAGSKGLTTLYTLRERRI